MRLDWTGESVGRRSRKGWGLGHPVPNGRPAFPHLENGGWRLTSANGQDGLGTVTFQHVTVSTRRLQPTVTGDEVKIESRGILHKQNAASPRLSALVGTVGWDGMGDAGPVLGERRPSVRDGILLGWNGVGCFQGCSNFCLEGQRIRFAWRPSKDRFRRESPGQD